MSRKRFAFVCVENAGRSQMAQAFFQKYATSGACSFSAGTRPAARVNPTVVEAMREVGIDISGNKPAALSAGGVEGSTLVSMGCMDSEVCPALLQGCDLIEWNIPDPRGKTIEEVRKIRDHIESRVRDLVSSMEL